MTMEQCLHRRRNNVCSGYGALCYAPPNFTRRVDSIGGVRSGRIDGGMKTRRSVLVEVRLSMRTGVGTMCVKTPRREIRSWAEITKIDEWKGSLEKRFTLHQKPLKSCKSRRGAMHESLALKGARKWNSTWNGVNKVDDASRLRWRLDTEVIPRSYGGDVGYRDIKRENDFELRADLIEIKLPHGKSLCRDSPWTIVCLWRSVVSRRGSERLLALAVSLLPFNEGSFMRRQVRSINHEKPHLFTLLDTLVVENIVVVMIVVKKMAVVMIVVKKSVVAYFLDSCNLGSRIVDFDDTPIVNDKHVQAVTFAFHKGETVATSLSVGNLG
ncbi:hypothetical protein Tco_1033050 [Tanacetum coccineum]|uniref:Uncharacterized protein n=1 Tax=Tanacetum coccineum TaxID=301880 RepID=A0ABQ5GDT8_9ASTR